MNQITTHRGYKLSYQYCKAKGYRYIIYGHGVGWWVGTEREAIKDGKDRVDQIIHGNIKRGI